jgi:hypothetical protein
VKSICWEAGRGLQAGVSPLDGHRPRRPSQAATVAVVPPCAPRCCTRWPVLPLATALALDPHTFGCMLPTHCSRLHRHAGPPCHRCRRRFPLRYRGRSFQQCRQWCRRWCSFHSCARPTIPQPQPGCCSSGDGGPLSSGPQATRGSPLRRVQVRTPSAHCKRPICRPHAQPTLCLC